MYGIDAFLSFRVKITGYIASGKDDGERGHEDTANLYPF
jgi:hypothetical protein